VAPEAVAERKKEKKGGSLTTKGKGGKKVADGRNLILLMWRGKEGDFEKKRGNKNASSIPEYPWGKKVRGGGGGLPFIYQHNETQEKRRD